MKKASQTAIISALRFHRDYFGKQIDTLLDRDELSPMQQTAVEYYEARIAQISESLSGICKLPVEDDNGV